MSTDARAKIEAAIAGEYGPLLTQKGNALELTGEPIYAFYRNGPWFLSRAHQSNETALAQLQRWNYLADRNPGSYHRPYPSPVLVTLEELGQLYRPQRTIGEADSTDMVRMVLDVITMAYARGATDIAVHLVKGHGQVRFRIHNRLRPIPELQMTAEIANRFINTVAQMASEGGGSSLLESSDGQIPNGRFPLPAGIESIRLHIHATAYGGPVPGRELSMRFARIDADEDASSDLMALGYGHWHVGPIDRAARMPKRATLLTGPMNSGKTTALQRLINRINVFSGNEMKIVEIGDPVERFVPGAVQVTLRKAESPEEKSRYLRGAFSDATRMDANIVLISEIRTLEVARIALELVMTGHGLLSTFHTPDAIGILDRLRALGLETYCYARPEYLGLLVAQRLVPVLCADCSRPLSESHPDEWRRWESAGMGAAIRSRNPAGCEHCEAGYVGRTLIAEMIEPDDQFMEIVEAGDHQRAKRYWLDDMHGAPMAYHAYTKVRDGLVSPDDIEREIGVLDLGQMQRIDDALRSRILMAA